MTTKTANEAFQQYQAHLAGMDEGAFIGSILYFEFRQPKVTREDLERWFVELGLSDSYLPLPIKPIEAFKRATGVTAKHRYTLPGDLEVELFVEHISTDDDRITRYIIRRVLDAKGKEIAYNTVGEAVFYKAGRTTRQKGTGGESVKMQVVGSPDAVDEAEVRKFIDTMHKDYRFFYDHYYVQAIRDMVRNYITSLNAISVRSGGAVYFVHRSRWDTVNRLTELVNNKIGNGCRIHVMPLIDTDYQRDMLSEAYQDEVEQEVDKLLGKVAKVNESAKGKKVRPKDYAELQDAWQDLSSRSTEYTSIFNTRQERAATALEMALDALMEMATRIDHGGK